MNQRFLKVVATVFLLGVALAFRAPQLDIRPLHGDEAVHGVKLAGVLETNSYRYDPFEYHGPTLNYFTLIPAFFQGQHTLEDVSDTTLRSVPLFFGIVLILLAFLCGQFVSWRIIWFCGFLTAISPEMVFYSRYYIQEMMLVAFTFGALMCYYACMQAFQKRWAFGGGIFLGLMYATKETFILAVCAFVVAALFVFPDKGRIKWQDLSLKSEKPRMIALSFLIALVVGGLFFSSFFNHPKGFVDSFLTYTVYLNRASENQFHIHPWYYYLKMLVFSKQTNGPIWSSGFVLVGAILGSFRAFTKKGGAKNEVLFFRLIAIYTLVLIIIYSLIPYKTPWNMLSFLHGLILLAGYGWIELVRSAAKTPVKIAYFAVIGLGSLHLCWQSMLTVFSFHSDPVNPHVYAHPTTDVYSMLHKIEQAATATGDRKNAYIQFVCTDDDYWPFPWYLRGYQRTGWYREVDRSAQPAPIIIASPELENDLLEFLYETPPPGERHLYVPLFDSDLFLRPGKELRGYVRKDLWDIMNRRQE